MAKTPARKVARKAPARARKPLKPDADGVVRLSGGNPQIAKGYGQAPIDAYIAAMPGWKSAVGRKIDTLISKAVPGVHKAVKWNSPMYGAAEGTWFLGLHVFEKYIKVAFFTGALLDPVPPVSSKQKNVRYFHVHEDDAFDDKQFTAWVKQAAKLPGQRM